MTAWAPIEGALVQEMVAPGAEEVTLGVPRDPDFGSVLVFGSGGILVELVQDSVLGLPPMGHAEALERVQQTRGARPLLSRW